MNTEPRENTPPSPNVMRAQTTKVSTPPMSAMSTATVTTATTTETAGAVATTESKKSKLKFSTADHCAATDIFFYDHYWDLLTFLSKRRERTAKFEAYMSSAECDLSEAEKAYERARYFGKERALMRRRRCRMRFADFIVYAQIGQGGYGEVYLTKKLDTGEICALKRMRKKTLVKSNEVYHIRNEKMVLSTANSEWLVKLLYAFQDNDSVYLAMEFVAGGDVRTLLTDHGCLHEDKAVFYMMEMLLAVNALHQLGYAHRDLKPENFLIDQRGHIKLTDFGLVKGELSEERKAEFRARVEQARNTAVNATYSSSQERRNLMRSVRINDPSRALAFSMVGSPEYMAPEILENKGYGLAVDQWSLGCTLFEFLAGYSPFSAQTIPEVWVNVVHWRETLKRPHYTGADAEFNLSDNAWDLITQLIAPVESRLTSATEIRAHPLFAGRNWDTIHDEDAPFVPTLNDEIDTTYFDDFAPVNTKNDPANRAQVAEAGAPDRHLWVGWTFKGDRKKQTDAIIEADDEPALRTMI